MTITVIPSSNPEVDAKTLITLFPELVLEKKHNNDDGAPVVILYDNNNQRRGWNLFLVPQQQRRDDDDGNNNNKSSNGSAASCVTRPCNIITLVLEPDEIANLMLANSNHLYDELSDRFVLDGDHQLLRIFLSGKTCAILFVSSTVMTATTELRFQLANLIVQLQKERVDDKGEPQPTREAIAVTSSSSTEQMSPPLFPSLQVKIRQPFNDDSMSTAAVVTDDDFPLNSRIPVPIETDLFVGNMLMIVRPLQPEIDDPYWNERIFSKRKRRMIIQIQGKFKRKPTGVVYAGGEVSDPMKLGLLSRGLCSILLNLVDRLNANMHYSFGDDERTEEAHIVVPAYTFFERLVATPSGETPPTLGDEFVEPEESLQQRRKSKSTGDWNTEDTYSMSFYSMYVDLPRWKIVNVPVTKDIDLKTFWGNSMLRIVLYERNAPPVGGDSRHLREYNKYALIIQVEFKGQFSRGGISNNNSNNNHNADGDASSTQGDDEILPWNTSKPLVKRQPSNLVLHYSESSVSLSDNYNQNDNNNNDAEEFYFFDAEQDLLEEEESSNFSSASRSLSPSPQTLLSRIDRLCPAWIDVWTSKGSYMPVYAFNVQDASRTVFRSYQLCTDCFEREDSRRLVEEEFSHRLSWNERNRRIFGHAFANALDDSRAPPSNKLDRFQRATSEYDEAFLKRKEPGPGWSDSKTKSRIQKSAFVARAISDRHWIEEWAKISDGFISFYQPEKGKARFRLSLSSIVNAERLDQDHCPLFPNYHFMAIETFGRRIYLMFASDSERDGWVSFLVDMLGSRTDKALLLQSKTSNSFYDQLMKVDDPSEEFLHKSSMWDCKQRRILNCRHFFFRHEQVDALALGEEALQKALARNDTNVAALGDFLDCAAKLKHVDANKLNDNERLSFFLNVYHTLLVHAFLVLGPPDNGFKWISYFNTISYQCSDDIFSLAELEHCIIRAEMSYPTQFISRFVVPKSKYTFSLGKPDYRINFALNCGSVSNPAGVPIFKASGLDQQLEATSRYFLDRQVTIKQKSAHEIVIHLPRVCQWFSDDFGNGANDDILRRIEPYLSEDKQRLLAACWMEGEKRYNFGELSVRFLPYSFECRYLGLADIH